MFNCLWNVKLKPVSKNGSLAVPTGVRPARISTEWGTKKFISRYFLMTKTFCRSRSSADLWQWEADYPSSSLNPALFQRWVLVYRTNCHCLTILCCSDLGMVIYQCNNFGHWCFNLNVKATSLLRLVKFDVMLIVRAKLEKYFGKNNRS